MSKRWQTAVVILFAVGLFAGPLAAQKKNQKDPIKIFIFTSASIEGFTDADQKHRNDSVKDLREALARNALVELVSQQGAADITLEVLGRGREENGSSTSRPGFFGGTVHTSNDTRPVVRVAIHAGSYSTEIVGVAPSDQWALWHVAARYAARDVEKWIKANYPNLLNRRFSQDGSVGVPQDAAISLPKATDSPRASASPSEPNTGGSEAARAYQERTTAGSSPAVNESGTVKVVSAPTGADIYVDGRFVGNSPAELQLSCGGHTVGAKMTGFKDWQREITVAGGAVNLNVMLVAGTNATAGVPQASTVTETQAAPVAIPPVETPTKIDATAAKRNVPRTNWASASGRRGRVARCDGLPK